jgi:hypothetical protein
MRILIDTNILIHLEDNKVVDKAFYRFYNLAIRNNCEVLYHTDCLKDLANDNDEKRKQIIKSKLAKYTPMNNAAPLDEQFSIDIGERKSNDRIDNVQLLQLQKGYVELFVTNDKGIHKKANLIGLEKQVLTSVEAETLLDEKFTLKIPFHPVLEHVSVRKLEEDFKSVFFESLREDYGGDKFMEWIESCAKKDRKCYRLKIENSLAALLIYKIESIDDHNLMDVADKVLKLCTLKVGNDALGMKLGELFINLMFQLAIHQKISYVYVTTYDKQHELIYLLEKFGFKKHSEFQNSVFINENIYLKSLIKEEQANNDGTTLHPFFRINKNKFIIPIKPDYYKTLFKDGNLREPGLFDNEDYGLSEIQGNTIIKAYVSKSPRTDLVPGDLLFFYSSEKYKSIEPVGILIEHKRVNDIEELWNLVKSKTVYEQVALKKLLEESNYLTVSIFRLAYYLIPILNFKDIKKMKSFSNKFQTITKMNEEDFNLFIKNRIDESFIVH